MAHKWDRGVLDAASWHEKEIVMALPNGLAQIEMGEHFGVLPVSLESIQLQTPCGMQALTHAQIAHYKRPDLHPARMVGENSGKYHALSPASRKALMMATSEAVLAAGGVPSGIFSLENGKKIIATWDLGAAYGIKNQLLLADSFDGLLNLTFGGSQTRVVCNNTLQIALGQDGAGMAKSKHSRSIASNADRMAQMVSTAVASGADFAKLYLKSERTILDPIAAEKLFSALHPEAPADASDNMKTRAANKRLDARLAARLPVNFVNSPLSVASIWNGATFDVTRLPNGEARSIKGDGDPTASLFYGSRADRVAEIAEIVERWITIVNVDGTEQAISAQEAVQRLSPAQILETMFD